MLTLPNFLTLLRIIAIPIFLVFLSDGRYEAAFLIFLAAAVTDAVDGALARLTDSRSELGAFLDPMADKLLLVSSFVVLGAGGQLPRWLVALVISRDLIVVTGYSVLFFVHQESIPVEPTKLGKVNTFFESVTVGLVLLHLARPLLPLEIVDLFIWSLTAATTAVSGVQYVYKGLLWHQRYGG